MSQSINALNQGTPTLASQIPYFDPSCGQDRRCSLFSVAALIVPTVFASESTQYAQPSATGFSVVVAPLSQGQDTFLVLTPVGPYASGAVALPDMNLCVDGQEVLLFSTQAVTAFSMTSANANAVLGVPSTLAQFGFLRMRVDFVNKSWYRVG